MSLNEFFSDLKKGQKEFGEDIGNLINAILLTIVYLVGVGFTFFFAKIFRKKFLDTEIDKNSKSYWEDLNLSKEPIERYYRQF